MDSDKLTCEQCKYWISWSCKKRGRCSSPTSKYCGYITYSYERCEQIEVEKDDGVEVAN